MTTDAYIPDDVEVSTHFKLLMTAFHITAIVGTALINYFTRKYAYWPTWAIILISIFAFILIIFSIALHNIKSPLSSSKASYEAVNNSDGDSSVETHIDTHILASDDYYQVPFVPFLPLAAITLNYFLITQLSLTSMMLTFAYFALSSTFYFAYSIQHSFSTVNVQDSTDKSSTSDHDRWESNTDVTSNPLTRKDFIDTNAVSYFDEDRHSFTLKDYEMTQTNRGIVCLDD